MASGKLHKRNVEQQASYGTSVQDPPSNQDEDTGVKNGLLSCIAGVGGVSIILWLVIFFFLEPYDPACTRVLNLEDLSKTLMKTEVMMMMTDTKWRVFGEELGLNIDQLDGLSDHDRDNMADIIIRTWYNSSKKVCFESIIQALVNIDETKTAELLAGKYKIKFKS